MGSLDTSFRYPGGLADRMAPFKPAAECRDGARLKAGDTVTVEMKRNEEERIVEVP